MARSDRSGCFQQFVEEIDYNEIETGEIVGKGTFGVVYKGTWRGQCVAIKHINSEGERKAFAIEVRQLSRVSHPNIVKLYGACTKNPVCLVMEYAEGGSLYNVLHGDPQAHYTAGHGISWALQCAQGVAYLHNMKPKPLIHRDLKPLNLLLVLGGLTLKICDFGTACDLNTYMTNNKGSAAWMAPEVFEGSRYTEKCDVFSWGIILWEILSRKKPFNDIGGSAYRIMWAVHVGQRPPLLEGCPKPLEELMQKCWSSIPENRPSMDEIVSIMSDLLTFFSGYDKPVEYSLSTDVENDCNDIHDTLNMPSTLNSQDNVTLHEEESPINGLADENTNLQPKPIPWIGSSEMAPLHIECDPNAWELDTSSESSWEIHNMAGLDKMLPKNKSSRKTNVEDTDLDNIFSLLDNELRPHTPDLTSPLSRQIFEEHKQLAQEYLKVQTEIALLAQHKREMLASVNMESVRQQQELRKLEDEKESLVKLYRNLKRQLEVMKVQQDNMLGNSPAAAVPPVVTGNNGWVIVPRHNSSRLS